MRWFATALLLLLAALLGALSCSATAAAAEYVPGTLTFNLKSTTWTVCPGGITVTFVVTPPAKAVQLLDTSDRLLRVR